MTALVVYESMFGNTREIAEAIAAGIASRTRVEVVEVSAAPRRLDDGIDLVVIGAPTHAHGLSRARSRSDAAGETTAPLISPGIGLREWLAELSPAAPGTAAAAFDTRFDKPRWLTGSAAQSAVRLLHHKGFIVAEPPESFFVEHTTGPLAGGEASRAYGWGETLAAHLPVAS